MAEAKGLVVGVGGPWHATNNTSLRRIVIGGTPGNRTVEVPPHGRVDA
ncbi:hypothetical protein [Plantactinospora endophytica]|nr:hypothetical protein [Plantactinospora endophytica]